MDNFFVDLESEEVLSNFHYKYILKEFEDNNFIEWVYHENKIIIYKPRLAFILMQSSLPLLGINDRLEHNFINDYARGYFEGQNKFKKEYLVSRDVLYGNNGKEYINTLHQMYFHKPIHLTNQSKKQGWKFVKDSSEPHIISSKLIYQYGFYSGLVFELDTLMSENPVFFKANFSECLNSKKEVELQQTIHDIIDIDGFENALLELSQKNPNNTFLEIIGKKIRPKSMNGLFAAIKVASDKNKLNMALTGNERQIAPLFLDHFGLQSRAEDASQNLRKTHEIAQSTKDFFSHLYK